MTKPTGRPPGRPKGAKSRHTIEAQAKTAELAAAVEQVLGTAFEGDAHAYLMSVYKDPTIPRAERLDAAGKAIRYEKPALATIENKGELRHVIARTPKTEDEWAAERAGPQPDHLAPAGGTANRPH